MNTATTIPRAILTATSGSLRATAAVQTKHGHDALGAFYDALWAEPDGTERQWLVMHSVRRCNAPVCL